MAPYVPALTIADYQFSNFYRRFICDYSKLAAPLMRLTSTLRPFSLTEEAEAAFSHLKVLLTTAPVLSHPDPAWFVVEVDASDSGVGAVLPQQSTSDGKLHLSGVAFFSRRLSTTERNYYVGNYNCWHWCWHFKSGVTGWLEGAAEPFIIWTNNKNLAYLRGAKRLNSRQAQWALFLARFDFLLTYQPGSKNVKRDVLSRQFSADLTHRDPEPILR